MESGHATSANYSSSTDANSFPGLPDSTTSRGNRDGAAVTSMYRKE